MALGDLGTVRFQAQWVRAAYAEERQDLARGVLAQEGPLGGNFGTSSEDENLMIQGAEKPRTSATRETVL